MTGCECCHSVLENTLQTEGNRGVSKMWARKQEKNGVPGTHSELRVARGSPLPPRAREAKKERKRKGENERKSKGQNANAKQREEERQRVRAREHLRSKRTERVLKREGRGRARGRAHERVFPWVCVRTCPRAASHSTAHVLVCTCRFWGLLAITLSVTCSTLLWSTFRVAARVYNLHPHSRHSHRPYRRRVATPPSCRTASSLDPCLECWSTG